MERPRFIGAGPQSERRPRPHTGAPDELAALTEREREVFPLIGRGLSNDQIAGQLVIGEATVKTHVNRILTKLALTTRVQLVVLAYESGMLQPGEQDSAAPYPWPVAHRSERDPVASLGIRE